MNVQEAEKGELQAHIIWAEKIKFDCGFTMITE